MNKRITKINWNSLIIKGEKIKKKDMSWTQAKSRFPKLSPFGDTDKDGVKNWLDCKPFDRKRQDLRKKWKEELIKEDVEEYLEEFPEEDKEEVKERIRQGYD